MQAQKIAIGIIKNESDEILVTQRKKNVHLPEFWEFPGGKVEAGESFKQALRREIQEEIGVHVKRCFKLIDFSHPYDDRLLNFQVFTVNVSSDDITVGEQQNFKWLNRQELNRLNFPSANHVMLNAINLPQIYMIADHSTFGERLEDIVKINLDAGIAQIQFRAPALDKDSYIKIANHLYGLCRKYKSRLIVNCDLDWCQHIQTVDIHLNSRRLKNLFDSGMNSSDINIYSASCHSSQEIEYANALNIGAVLIGPVQHTLSHSQSKPLGWPGFSKLCGQSNSPVYAVGGLGKSELATARVNGAQGIAGIRDFEAN